MGFGYGLPLTAIAKTNQAGPDPKQHCQGGGQPCGINSHERSSPWRIPTFSPSTWQDAVQIKTVYPLMQKEFKITI
jgi:hypothetical protein